MPLQATTLQDVEPHARERERRGREAAGDHLHTAHTEGANLLHVMPGRGVFRALRDLGNETKDPHS